MAEYKDFKYKGELLSSYNGFIVNEGDDLKFFNPSNFSHEFATPQFGKQSYFLGTTRENREFNFNIALSEVTLTEYKNFLAWLNPEEEGTLSFNYNTNYGYDVKINSISEGTFYVIEGTDPKQYHIDLQVSFITKNDWAAKWIGPLDIPNLNNFDSSIYDYIDNNLENSFIEYNDTTDIYTITNYHQVENYYKIEWSLENLTSEGDYIELTVNDDIIKITNAQGAYYTEFGIAITPQGDFLDYDNIKKIILKENESFSISYNSGNITITTGDYIKVEPISREII